MGFEYFYGFIGGETHQYYPVLFENTRAVEPKTSPEEGYHLMTDMTDRAINYGKYSKSVAPQKPFFMYFAPGAAHAPHHAPKEWSHKFKGQFDQGWEKVREKTVRGRFGIDTFGVGMDTGSPVSNTYKSPFALTGAIQEVRIELK